MAGERFFDLPDIDIDASSDEVNRGKEFYISHLVDLSQECWDYYEKQVVGSTSKQASLYIGSLGPCVFLRYRLATSPSFPLLTVYHKQSMNGGTNAIIKDSRIQMLQDAMIHVDCILQKRLQDNQITHRITLLEGELVGALTMKIVIGNAIVALEGDEDGTLIGEIEAAMTNLLLFGRKYILSEVLAPSECEVLYGRCGYLKAIKFIQTEIGDPKFGRDIASEIINEVWKEGRQDVDPCAIRTPLPLMWSWRSTIYLGACHGVTGILHTLLDFQDVLISIDRNAMKLIRETAALLRENMCTESGNLSSSIKSSGSAKKSDTLVQWCHGAPGHLLLLTQMATKTQNQTYLEVAKDLAASVIQPRGLLRKGVGLCHGVSGNSFCFLSLANAIREIQGDGHTSSKWINTACGYANFAVDHFDELKPIPDRPFSLYEGMAGLSCLLLALVEGGEGPSSKFPLYEI
mmetsp:Transcript_2972/g.4336  ORF Transcript_2972/g.4336 Transcript_2972/m.4336 type:complete len:461 (-) Transcript_2972:528-1910(-)